MKRKKPERNCLFSVKKHLKDIEYFRSKMLLEQKKAEEAKDIDLACTYEYYVTLAEEVINDIKTHNDGKVAYLTITRWKQADSMVEYIKKTVLEPA